MAEEEEEEEEKKKMSETVSDNAEKENEGSSEGESVCSRSRGGERE